MTVAIIVPARLASTRFPAKPLAMISGRPLVVHAIERILGSQADEVILATDDHRIKEAVSGMGCSVFMSKEDHSCGTDRIAEVAAEIDVDYIINVQGDQLLPGPEMINGIINGIVPGLAMATLYSAIGDLESVRDENTVKAIVSGRGEIIYMSRWPIPFDRGGVKPTYFKQVGIYVFSKEALLDFSRLEPTTLEMSEGVELLRALDNGLPLRGIYTDAETQDVNTPPDIVAAEEFIKKYPLNRAS